ncbi:cupin domain-containing protein, partial [Streptomyces calidiresistens]|uniref:cupin domain-containing protein n=1 Tax=Streptomyces calidiresistens TaxID=1485586 RepID=UPI001E49C2BD
IRDSPGAPLGDTVPFGGGPAPFGASTPELCLVLDGEMEIEEADGTRLSLRAGEVCTLTPGTRRRAVAAGCEILLVDGAGRARTDRTHGGPGDSPTR